MRIRSNIADYNLVLNTINLLGLATAHSGAGDELVPGRNVDKNDRIERRMNFSFHSDTYRLISPDAL